MGRFFISAIPPPPSFPAHPPRPTARIQAGGCVDLMSGQHGVGGSMGGCKGLGRSFGLPLASVVISLALVSCIHLSAVGNTQSAACENILGSSTSEAMSSKGTLELKKTHNKVVGKHFTCRFPSASSSSSFTRNSTIQAFLDTSKPLQLSPLEYHRFPPSAPRYTLAA